MTDKTGLPLVSVVIPTHNRAGVVHESIASVRQQRGAGVVFDLEIIVVDDASSDATPEVLKGYPDIRCVRLPINRGPSAARNEGIKASTGKYVAFNDDDDLWLPSKLSLLVPILESDPQLNAVYSQLVVNCGDSVAIIPDANAPSGHLFPMLLIKDCPIAMIGILVRREVFDHIGYFDETLTIYEDFAWVLRVAVRYYIAFRPGLVALYRLSMSGQYVTQIIEGRNESTLRTIVENALKLLPPDCKDYTRIRREAFARLEFRLAEELEWVEQYARMRIHLEQAVKELPSLSRDPAVRAVVERQVCRLAFSSESPMAVIRELTKELKRDAQGSGLSGYLSIQSLNADIWSATADRLATVSQKRNPKAALAAIHAALSNPVRMGSPRILKVIARTILGPRAYLAVTGLLAVLLSWD